MNRLITLLGRNEEPKEVKVDTPLTEGNTIVTLVFDNSWIDIHFYWQYIRRPGMKSPDPMITPDDKDYLVCDYLEVTGINYYGSEGHEGDYKVTQEIENEFKRFVESRDLFNMDEYLFFT